MQSKNALFINQLKMKQLKQKQAKDEKWLTSSGVISSEGFSQLDCFVFLL